MKKGAAKPEKEETTIKEDNKDSLKKKAEPTKDTSLKKDTKVDMKVDAKVEPKTIIKEESNVKDKNKSLNKAKHQEQNVAQQDAKKKQEQMLSKNPKEQKGIKKINTVHESKADVKSEVPKQDLSKGKKDQSFKKGVSKTFNQEAQQKEAAKPSKTAATKKKQETEKPVKQEIHFPQIKDNKLKKDRKGINAQKQQPEEKQIMHKSIEKEEKIEKPQQKQDVIQSSGLLKAYESFLKSLCKLGLPSGDIFELAAQHLEKFEKRKIAHDLKEKAENQIRKKARFHREQQFDDDDNFLVS